MKMQDVKEKAAKIGVKAGRKTKTDLIRTIQESEGNIPCFQTVAFFSCFEEDCCWRPECSTAR